MNVSIIGTGAMASLFGARLSRFADVALLGTWTEAVQAFRREGIHVEGEGTFRVHAASDPDDAPPADLAIVLGKRYPTERAARGDWSADSLAYEVTALLNAADLSSVVSANVEALAWGKVIINAAINPLTAILRVPNGALAPADDPLGLMGSIVPEAVAVAKAHHVELPYPNPFERVKAVALATATNHSSMLQDVLKGRPTEIDAINGKIVEHGRAGGVPTPRNATPASVGRA